MEVQNLTRFGVYERQVSFECSKSNMGKISALGIKLPKQAVQFLVCIFPPSTIGIGKIHVTVQPFLDLALVCKFCAPVTGNAFEQLRRKRGQH